VKHGLEGVMPKEVIKESPERKRSKPRVEVRWGSAHNDYVELYIDRGQKFSFHGNDSWYTGLGLILDNESELDRLIKALKKAKRKTKLR
jgi:hypothetical protein